MRRFVAVAVVGVLSRGDSVGSLHIRPRWLRCAIRSAPAWQLSFAALDIGVPFAIIALSIRGKTRGAFWLLVAESAYYLIGTRATTRMNVTLRRFPSAAVS
jgi:hypothetical protein